MAEEYLNINPVPQPPREEPTPESEPPREGGLAGLLKNALTFLLLLLVVLASFWVSFQLGRRILMPVKKMPGPPKIAAPVPETPDSIKALQRLQAAVSAEARKKTTGKAKPPAKKTTVACRPARAVKPVPARSTAGQGYYKVQAGWFVDKALAGDLAERVRAAGCDVFVRKANGGWRVQAGAFRLKKQAEALRQQLITKGFKPQVIFE
ncbi:MAG: SPOR domain-containing protein [Candidatus Margulisiibacteriota bacterium]